MVQVNLFKFQIENTNINFWIMSLAENFEELLKNFFSLYHPRQVKKVGRIVQEFRGQEIMLLKVLCDKYKKAYTIIPGLNEKLEELYADPPETETEELNNHEETQSEESNEEEPLAIEEIVSEDETDDKVPEEEVLEEEEEEEEEEEVVTEPEEEEDK